MAEPGQGFPERTHTRTGPASRSGVPFVLPERWLVERPLGEGGQSEVWLAYDRQLEAFVAVKVFSAELSREAAERLRREVRLGQALRHPNLVRVYELIEAGDRLAYAMEWMTGGSLSQRLAGGPLPIAEVVRAADEALAALSFLHERRIVHRDVKPSNLLIDVRGHVHLADLGLVRPLEPGATLTRTAVTVGTPAFMSPEQIHNQRVTPAADLYSLGATLYQLLTGALPFAGDSDLEVAVQHVVAPAPDPRKLRADCPRYLAFFVRRLLEKSPRDRFRDAGQARQALAAKGTGFAPRVYRRAALWATSAAFVVMLGAWSVYWLRASPGGGPTLSVQTDANLVRGLDARGRAVWSYKLASPVRQVERGDLDGDGRIETVVAASPPRRARAHDEAASEVLIVDADGKVRSRVSLETTLRYWPYLCRKLFFPYIKLVDLTGGGRRDLVVFGHSRDSFPTAVFLYRPALDRWDLLLLHSGYVMDVAPAPGGTPTRLRVLAFNNRLAMVHAVGELAIAPPSPGSGMLPFASALTSPDMGGVGSADFDRWVWYTLCSQVEKGDPVGKLVIGRDASTAFQLGPTTVRFDTSGEPLAGPTAGRDLAAVRRSFLNALVHIDSPPVPFGVAQLRALSDEIRRTAAPLLVEPQYRAVLETHVASAMARLGDIAGAAALLRAAQREVPYEDVAYRLAADEALLGDLDASRALAARVAAACLTPSGASRAPHLLLALAIERRDVPEVAQLIAANTHPGDLAREAAEGIAAAAWARAHLFWDAVEESDQHVRSWDFAPEGQAVACLARWRAGKAADADIDEMTTFTRDNPDVALVGEVARAASMLGLGRAVPALAEVERVIPALEAQEVDPDVVDPYSLRQVLDLARALRVTALAQAGRRAEAVAEARRLRAVLRPGLLPARLVGEALGGTS